KPLVYWLAKVVVCADELVDSTMPGRKEGREAISCGSAQVTTAASNPRRWAVRAAKVTVPPSEKEPSGWISRVTCPIVRKVGSGRERAFWNIKRSFMHHAN